MLESLWIWLKKGCINIYNRFDLVVKPYIFILQNYFKSFNVQPLKIFWSEYKKKLESNIIFNEIKLFYTDLVVKLTSNILSILVQSITKYITYINKTIGYIQTILLICIRNIKNVINLLISFLQKFFKKFNLIKMNVLTNLSNFIQILNTTIADLKFQYINYTSAVYVWFKTNKNRYWEYNQSLRLAISLVIWYFDTEWFQRFLDFIWKYVNYIVLRVHFQVIVMLFYFYTHRLQIILLTIIMSVYYLSILYTFNITQYMLFSLLLIFIYALIKLFNTNIYININKLIYYYKIKKYLYY